MKYFLGTFARVLRTAQARKPARPGRRSRPPALEILEDRAVPTTLPAGFQETLVTGNLVSPTAMTLAPDGRVFITIQTGDLRVVKNGTLLATPFLHLNVDSNGERGLLGVAFDPNFANNRFLYVYYTVPGAGVHNRVSRFTADSANLDVAAAGSEQDILDLNPLSSATNHNGGAMHFGKDGKLYVDVGENANALNSQTLGNLLGKVLRLDVSQITASDPANSAKLIPADNPFVNQATGINQVIYALGFRNPFTFGVQPGTGTIFINDVGQNTWEEIDKLVAGGNYGWDKSEGFASTVPPPGLGPGTYQDPQLAYNHSGGPAGGGIAIVGGSFYNPPAGAASPFPSSYLGKYFYADLGGNWIRVFDPANPGSLANPDTSSGFATGTVGNPVDVVVAPDGGLYYLARGSGGELLKISFTATTIGGTVFQDVNHNGRQDPGEAGLAGQTVFIDLHGTSILTADDPTVMTNSQGSYQLTVAGAGTYTVRQLLFGGVLLDTPAGGSYTVTIASGASVTDKNFGDVLTNIAVPLTLPPATSFPAQGNANADYVEALYRSILQRNADAGGLAFWTGLLNQGTSRTSVAQTIWKSPEHFTQEVTAFYATLLGRSPDPTGLAAWVTQLRNGTPEEQIVIGFLGSQEFLSRGDKFFVDHLYTSILGRPAEPLGEAFWLGQLGDDSSGTPTGHPATQTHQQVIQNILFSTESLTRLIEGNYQIFLGRTSDVQGLNYWLNALRQGNVFAAIAEGFLASDEFYQAAAVNG